MQPELVEFFERYDAAPPDVQGSDKCVGQPLPKEMEEMASALTMLEYDAFRKPLLAVLFHGSGVHEIPNQYIIEAPITQPSLPLGRSTCVSTAYDVQRKKLVIMKDLWPVFAYDDMMEGRVYEQLNKGNVPNTPLCINFCDGDERYSETHSGQVTGEHWLDSSLITLIPTCRHHRLILDTVGRPLNKFTSSKELVHAVRTAVIGMNIKDHICYSSLTHLL